MKTKSLMLLLIAAAFLSLSACKKEVESGGPTGSKSIDPLLLGKWGWYSFYTRVFDDVGNVYETDPFEYGSDDVQDDFEDNGTYTRTTDNGYVLPGIWTVKNGKLVLDGSTEYEYSFENNNRTLILKQVLYSDNNGTRYRNEEYTILSRDWHP